MEKQVDSIMEIINDLGGFALIDDEIKINSKGEKITHALAHLLQEEVLYIAGQEGIAFFYEDENEKYQVVLTIKDRGIFE